MVRRKRLVGFLILVLLLAVFYLPPLSFNPLPPSPPSGDRWGYFEYRGIIHAHSRYSDGKGTIEEVAKAASSLSLDFIITTDHDTLLPLAEGKEGYYGKTLLLVGTELSTFSGHMVALDIPDPVYRFPPMAEEALADVHEEGGIAIAAHPDSPKVPWTNWDLPLDGMELINTDSEWRYRSIFRLAYCLALYPASPRYALLLTFFPPGGNLKRWDSFTRRRRFIGSAGADAHGGIPLIGGAFLPFPSYRAVFSLVKLHLLSRKRITGRLLHDKRVIYSAIRRGNFYLGLDGVADARGFFFGASSAGKRGIMGDLIPFSREASLRILVPNPAPIRVVLIRDGEVVKTFSSSRVSYRPSLPGTYRVEVYLPEGCYPKGKVLPWIISNPIYLWDEERIKAEPKRKEVTSPPIKGKGILMVEDFEGRPRTRFGLEHDPASSEEVEVVDEGAHPSSKHSLRFSFHLAPTVAKGREITCALSNRVYRDLSPYSAISFFVKGDRTYRFWLQLREYDENGGKEKVEVWGTSVKVHPYWEHKVIPFSSFVLLSKGTNGRLELARSTGFFFIVNNSSVKPGTSGTIWFDDISFVR